MEKTATTDSNATTANVWATLPLEGLVDGPCGYGVQLVPIRGGSAPRANSVPLLYTAQLVKFQFITKGKGKGDVSGQVPLGFLLNADGSLRTFTRDSALRTKSRGVDEVPNACQEYWNGHLCPFNGMPDSLVNEVRTAFQLAKTARFFVESFGLSENAAMERAQNSLAAGNGKPRAASMG